MHRGIFACFFFFACFAFRSSADEMPASKPAVREEIVATIEAQLAAFRESNSLKAYSYAAEGLRTQMPLAAFARLVRQSYPEIWQSTRAEFGLVRDDGKRARLVVHVFAKASDATYDYVLFKEDAGWRIGGVVRRESRPAETI